jgi:RNA polymerase sigma-70 factor, ECF subfamily
VNESSVETPDEALLARIAQQDRDAFTEFYDRHARILFSVAVRIVNDHAEAEEVLQEVFVQLWEKSQRYNSQLGKPLQWVLALARNKSIDRLRSLGRRSRFVAGITPEEAAAPASDYTATEAAAGKERAELIRSAVQSLPADQRQAIEMAFLGGMTQQDIAASLKQPLGTIKARIRRGMLKLRDGLKGRL